MNVRIIVLVLFAVFLPACSQNRAPASPPTLAAKQTQNESEQARRTSVPAASVLRTPSSDISSTSMRDLTAASASNTESRTKVSLDWSAIESLLAFFPAPRGFDCRESAAFGTWSAEIDSGIDSYDVTGRFTGLSYAATGCQHEIVFKSINLTDKELGSLFQDGSIDRIRFQGVTIYNDYAGNVVTRGNSFFIREFLDTRIAFIGHSNESLRNYLSNSRNNDTGISFALDRAKQLATRFEHLRFEYTIASTATQEYSNRMVSFSGRDGANVFSLCFEYGSDPTIATGLGCSPPNRPSEVRSEREIVRSRNLEGEIAWASWEGPELIPVGNEPVDAVFDGESIWVTLLSNTLIRLIVSSIKDRTNIVVAILIKEGGVEGILA